MGILRKQIGWSQESNLLWEILRQLNKLAGAIFNLKPKYKVYTALLTQSGGDNYDTIYQGTTTVGVTYEISGDSDPNCGYDFTMIGAPNNNIGTMFVATRTSPNWNGGCGVLRFNTGAPVVTVLENTIGNIWFSYNGVGDYSVNSDGLFTLNKTVQFINSSLGLDEGILIINNVNNTNSIIYLASTNSIPDRTDGYFNNTPIEIRVYN